MQKHTNGVIWARALIGGFWRVVPAHGEQWKIAEMRKLVGVGDLALKRAQDEAIYANQYRAQNPKMGMVLTETRKEAVLHNTHEGAASFTNHGRGGFMTTSAPDTPRRGIDWDAEGGKPAYVRYPRNAHFLMRAYAKAHGITIERALLTLSQNGFEALPPAEQDQLCSHAARLRGDA